MINVMSFGDSPLPSEIWDEEHLKALLRMSYHPPSLIQEEPWHSWIERRGGRQAVYDYLETCPLRDRQRELLHLLREKPERKSQFYSDTLNISRRTYFYHLNGLISALVSHLNAWTLEPTAEQMPLPQSRIVDLPQPMTAMVGAEESIATASALILRPDVRLLTITGPGGVGKTRLSIQVAHEVVDEYRDGACFVSLASVEDPELVIAEIARNLDIQEAPGRTLLDTLKSALRNREFLLILDNFEHLTPAASLVTELLKAVPDLNVIVTSRHLLNVYGEYQFVVPTLETPDPEQTLTPDTLSLYPAARLFVERAQAGRPDFALTEENGGAIAEICRRLDGLPLAIELAAACTKILSVDAIRSRLDQRLALLQHGPRDFAPRHQTLWNAIHWSYDLLDEEEKALFRCLGAFAHSWDAEAAGTVCRRHQILSELRLLEEKSLVRIIPNDEPQFEMLQTIREYALEQLEAENEAPDVRRRHALYYTRMAEEAAGTIGTPDQRRWLARIQVEHDNVRVALNWALENQEIEIALRLIGGVWRFWQVMNILDEGLHWMKRGLRQSRSLQSVDRARVLWGAGWLSVSKGNGEEALSTFRKGLALAKELNERRMIGRFLLGIGERMLARGQLDEAHVFYTDALSVFHELGDEEETAWSLDHLGRLALERGEYEEAREHLRKSLALFQKMDHQWGIAWSLDHLGHAAWGQGDYARAERLLTQALDLLHAFDNRWQTAWTLYRIATVQIAAGKLDEARRSLRQSLTLHRQGENVPGLLTTLEGFATLALAFGRPRRAVELCGAIDRQREEFSIDTLHSLSPHHFEELIASAKEHLSATAFAAVWEAGQALSFEEAIAYALEETPVRT